MVFQITVKSYVPPQFIEPVGYGTVQHITLKPQNIAECTPVTVTI